MGENRGAALWMVRESSHAGEQSAEPRAGDRVQVFWFRDNKSDCGELKRVCRGWLPGGSNAYRLDLGEGVIADRLRSLYDYRRRLQTSF